VVKGGRALQAAERRHRSRQSNCGVIAAGFCVGAGILTRGGVGKVDTKDKKVSYGHSR